MIGGTDIVMPAYGEAAALDACARVLCRHWPHIRFEDAVTGEKYRRLDEIPFGKVRELLAYPDAESEAAWDAESTDSPENSMLCLILGTDEITVVLDNPETAAMSSILAEIRRFLRSFSDVYVYERAA